MISDEAVEAADSAYRRTVPTGDGTYQRRAILSALEAAAPYLMAKAWDEGWDKRCNYDIAFNPYRSQA